VEVIKKHYKDLQAGKQISCDKEHCYTISKQKILENRSLNLTGVQYKNNEKISHQKWPMTELSEVLDYEQPTKYIVASTDYSDEYKTPVLTAGKTFLLGYSNEKEGIFKDGLPVIIFDDFTTAIKLVDFPFKVKSSAMKILHSKKEKADIKFLFYMMKQIEFSTGTHKRYWISQYSKIKIPLPPLNFQKKIVTEIENCQKMIDDDKKHIETLQQKIEAKIKSIYMS